MTAHGRWAALAFAGIAGTALPAGAASSPHSIQLQIQCGAPGMLAGKSVTIPDCKAINNGLQGWFAGRLDWYSGNQLLFQENGPFFAITATNEGDVQLFLDANGDANMFASIYDSPQTSIFAAPSLNWKLFITPAGKAASQVAAQTYMPLTSALWSRHSEDTAATGAKIDAEAAARAAADNTLQTAINALAGNNNNAGLAAETAARIAGDATTLTAANKYTDQQVAAEATARTSADNTEAAARAAGDTALTSSVKGETTARQSADTTELLARINADSAETNARSSADNTLNANITAEAQARVAGDATLTNNVSAEIGARQNGDGAVQAAIAAELARATAAESNVNAAIAAETARAKVAEAKLNGATVSNAQPLDGNVLVWSAMNSDWEPKPASGNLPTCSKDQVLVSQGGGKYVCKDFCQALFTDITTDPKNCGACGTACMFNNAQGSCANSTCAVGQCNNGFGNCDNNGNNGCETDLTNTNANCGKCGNACGGGTPNCVAGMCSSGPAPVTYNGTFVSGGTPTTACTDWTTFRGLIVNGGPAYTKVTLKGSNDQTGVNCTGANANTLCVALKNGAAVGPLACNGRNWMVGNCGNGPELSAEGSICACPSPGYLVRPCIGNSNWGGINTATCGGGNQTITVICQ